MPMPLMSPKVNTPRAPPSSPMPSHKCSVALATNNGEGEGDGLCYDDNDIVVIITQAVSIALAIFGGKGEGDSLCYDDNFVVVVITQTSLPQALLALALAILLARVRRACGRQFVL